MYLGNYWQIHWKLAWRTFDWKSH